MKLVRIVYRVCQFWRMLWVKTDPHELEQVRAAIGPELWELFTQMQPGEKDHAMRMYHRLVEQGDAQPDLLQAALLHDVGKLRYRLNLLQRTMVVLARAAIPGKASRWGSQSGEAWNGVPSWRKAFILAEKHAAWGADMAHAAGASMLTETLIRQHHHPHIKNLDENANNLLHKLWVVDNDC
jgi:hypothetical protein